MPIHRYFFGASSCTVVIGLCCVCIVTSVGFVCAGGGQKSQKHGHGGIVTSTTGSGVMGHKSTLDKVGTSENTITTEDLGRSRSNKEHEVSVEERLLANQYNGGFMGAGPGTQELKNPHPHISVPQLPFCKPTKTTVGSSSGKSSSDESKKASSSGERSSNTREDELSGNEYDEDEESEDLEIVNTADRALESDRKFLVATLDGRVTLLNKTGHPLWSVKTGELFSSTISSLQLNENGKLINLIPSLTGGVYKYDGDSLFPMPFNADSLLKKSFKISNDVVITGGKELRTYGVDIKSGNVRYECGISGCVVPLESELDTSPKTGEDPIVLVIKKQLQTVRAIDSSTGAERWNFSVGTHEMALAGVTEGCYHGEQRDNSRRMADFLKIVIPEGRVFGADRENQVVWDQHFEAPISQTWILENGQLVSVDPITNTPLTDVPSLYIGFHNQQFYVQESQTTAEKMEHYFGLGDGNALKKKPLNIGWKPTTRIDGVSGSTALSTISPRPNWVSFSPTPNFRPIYVFDKDSVGDVLEGPNDTLHEDDDEEEEDPGLDFSEGITQVIVMSLWFWWKEVLGISLLTAVLLNVILMKPIMRAVRSQTIREMSVYFQQLWNRWKEEEESRSLLARHSTNLPSLPAPPVPDCIEEERRKRSTSSSSTGSFNSPSAEDREIYFCSQYMNEFIPIECLGRGGFGVVFEAKKKIDDRTYAVKRITLPCREKARVRVMREVKALAQLDHRNIVRYFNAWIESPPQGWLEKNDPLWAKTLIGSTSPTMDYPSDLLGSSMFPESQRGTKPDHSKISVPNTPSEHPDDDSYIIFETSTSGRGTFSKTSWDTSGILTKPLLEETSIGIPHSEDNSTASSVSGAGFFARRPTSLNIHSSVSSFHEEISTHKSVAENDEDEISPKDDDKESEVSQDASSVMYLYIQQELCQKRTLQDWLRSERSRDLSLVVNLFSQIVEAVEYVHSKKLIHRDLKPSNIFLAGVTENGLGVLTVKIGDFGLATTAYAEIETEKLGASPMSPMDDNNSGSGQTVRINLTGHVGTHLYMSPEQYQRKPYDYKVDIYSLGLIFFELLVPFSTDMERYNTLTGVRKLNFPEKFKDSFPDEFELIRTMISHNPNVRPDAIAINAWVKGHIINLPDSSTSSQVRGSGDAVVGRSISSPAEMITCTEVSSESEKKKLKPRFYKTQSVM